MNNLHSFDVAYATKKGYQYSFLVKLDEVYGLLNEFRRNNFYTWYYLAHKINKDENVKEQYQQLVLKAKSLYDSDPNPISACLLASVMCLRCNGDDTFNAVKFFENSAAEDYPDAVYRLADCYYRGIVYKKDYKKAFELFSRASELGSLEAKARLGDLYYYGEGVLKSFPKAFELYSQAYDGGRNVLAVEGLAYIYNNAEQDGFKRNVEEARRLYLSIADRSTEAFRIIGTTYLSETSDSPSIPNAIKYLEKAAEYGEERAAEGLSMIYDSTDWAGTYPYYSSDKHSYWKDYYDELHGYKIRYDDGRKGVTEVKARRRQYIYIAMIIVYIILGWNIIRWAWHFIVSIPGKIIDLIF